MASRKLVRAALWTALAATLGSAILAPSEEVPRRPARPGAAPAVVSGGTADAGKQPAPALSVVFAAQPQPEDAGPVLDLFQPRKPPPPPAAAAAKPPAAPALPFQYMGTVEKEGVLKIYLAQGDKFHELSVGDSFAQNYRLDAIGAEGVTLTYLPLDIQQTLATGGAR